MNNREQKADLLVSDDKAQGTLKRIQDRINSVDQALQKSFEGHSVTSTIYSQLRPLLKGHFQRAQEAHFTIGDTDVRELKTSLEVILNEERLADMLDQQFAAKVTKTMHDAGNVASSVASLAQLEQEIGKLCERQVLLTEALLGKHKNGAQGDVEELQAVQREIHEKKESYKTLKGRIQSKMEDRLKDAYSNLTREKEQRERSRSTEITACQKEMHGLMTRIIDLYKLMADQRYYAAQWIALHDGSKLLSIENKEDHHTAQYEHDELSVEVAKLSEVNELHELNRLRQKVELANKKVSSPDGMWFLAIQNDVTIASEIRITEAKLDACSLAVQHKIFATPALAEALAGVKKQDTDREQKSIDVELKERKRDISTIKERANNNLQSFKADYDLLFPRNIQKRTEELEKHNRSLRLAPAASADVSPRPQKSWLSSKEKIAVGVSVSGGIGAGVTGGLCIAGIVNAWNPVGWGLLALGVLAFFTGALYAGYKYYQHRKNTQTFFQPSLREPLLDGAVAPGRNPALPGSVSRL